MTKQNTIRKSLIEAAKWVCFLNIFVIAMCVLDSELRWLLREGLDENGYRDYWLFYVLNLVRLISLGSCLASAYLTYRWYIYHMKHLKQTGKMAAGLDFPLNLRMRFLIEAGINLVHIPFGADLWATDYNSAQWLDYLTIATFPKIYIAVRLMKEFSPLNSNSGRFIGSFTNIQFTDLFYLKTWLKDNPMFSLCFGVLSLLFICSYMIFLSERVHPVDCGLDSGKFSTFSNSLWLLIVTVFTVGYGELTP